MNDTKEFPVSWIPADRSQTSGDVISMKLSTSNNAQDTNFHVLEYKLRASDRPLKKRMLKKTASYGFSAVLGGKNMPASSLNVKSNGLHEMKQAKVFSHSRLKSSELISSDTDACSVGSCDTDTCSLHTLYSDAELFCSSVPKRKLELKVCLRVLELHAYRTTLEALYASGPLSWEQEAMLTNLRIMLHVSNDEHLKELKRLISA